MSVVVTGPGRVEGSKDSNRRRIPVQLFRQYIYIYIIPKLQIFRVSKDTK